MKAFDNSGVVVFARRAGMLAALLVWFLAS
jgi:hypothetical protein